MATTVPSFPIEDPAQLANLEQTHQLVRMTPFGQERLAYSLVLTRGWVTEEDLGEQPAGIGRLARVGLFAERPGPEAAAVQILVSFLPLEIDVRDWVEYQAAQFGARLASVRSLQFACGPVVDAGGLAGEGWNQYVVRVIGHADGGRIFLVVALAPERRYPQLRRDVAIATNSFKLLRPTGSPQLEQLLDVALGDPAFRVAYPASWVSREVTEKVRGKAGVDLLLAGPDDRLLAYLRVKAIGPAAGETSPEALKRTATEELAEADVYLAGGWAPDNSPGVEGIAGLESAHVAGGRLNEAPVELRLGLVRRGPLLFAVTLVSAPRASDALLWMRSKRAYEIALITARPGD